MGKHSFLFVRLVALLLLTGTVSTLSAQNFENEFILMTVKTGANLKLRFAASADSLMIDANLCKVVRSSGYFTDTSFMVGRNWTEVEVVAFYDQIGFSYCTSEFQQNYLTHFGCESNYANVTSLVDLIPLLEYLYCSGNNLTSLDVVKSSKLKYLDCNNNNLSTLDVSKNTALTHLNCSRNKISSLDVGKNTKLTYLNFSTNKISSLLGYGKDTLLVELKCDNNNLSSLPVGSLTKLTNLVCAYNNLKSLNVSMNTGLTKLICCGNKISSLDVGNNTKLKYLDCGDNNLSSLDVHNNTALETLYCSKNNLSLLDVRKNSVLTELWCYGNPLSTGSYDAIMCALPEQSSGLFYPLTDASDTNAKAFMSANSKNAISKGWKVRYHDTYGLIPATNGTFSCSSIRLGVKNARVVNLHFAAAADNTPVTLVCGSTDTTFYVRKFISYGDMHHFSLYTSDTEVTIYGALTHFRCSGNHDHITSLDVSGNPALKGLLCYENSITSLDVSGNPALEELLCYDNGLTSLNLGADTALTILSCYKNRLTSLDVSRCAALTELRCQLNQLTSLDVSHNPRMEVLYCHSNSIPTLDLGGNPALKVLGCRSNAFTTAEYDKIMCMLPERTEEAKFFPLGDSLDTNYNLFMATNSANATAKGWKILYGSNNKPVPATTGDFDCITLPVSEAAAEHALRVWPNPARTQLRIANATGEVCVYDLAGRVVYRSGQAVPEELQINISGWAKGMYFVRAGGMTVKFVKE